VRSTSLYASHLFRIETTHSTFSQKEQQDARLKALAQEGLMTSPNAKLSKSARAYAKTYKTGPPLVPQIIVERILNYITKVNVRKKHEFVYMVCKYWSLKREARRGAPLLKRLHLEPWTASNAGKVQTEEERAVKLEVRFCVCHA
jgi:hypothetical protein